MVIEDNKVLTDFSFPKDGRLHHRSLVEGLFRKGKSFYEFPFRVTWRMLSSEELQKNFRDTVPPGIGKLQMLVTVPKKKRRHAVDRVKMRRRIRESYRLHRHSLMRQTEEIADLGTLSVALVYVHDKNLGYTTIEEKMMNVLDKLVNKIASHAGGVSETIDHKKNKREEVCK